MATKPNPRQKSFLPSLTAPAPPPAISERKAQQLCKERAELEAQRLEYQRFGASIAKQVDAIDEQLLAFVAATATDKVRSVSLKKWRLSIVTVAKSLFYKAELEKEVGLEEVERRRRALGTKDVLNVDAIT